MNSYYPCRKPLGPFRLFAKKEYNEKVKTDSYEINLESKPFDNNIRKPEFDWFKSHFNRWGYEKERPWTTTTADMLSQRTLIEEISNPNKKIQSYYTYHDKLDCEQNHLEQNPCISQYAVNDYITTMQYSYKPKHELRTNRDLMKETPFYLNRRFLMNNTTGTTNKFWDDNHLEEIELLHKHKPNRLISYNFMMGCQSDGTSLPKDLYTLL